MYYRYGYPPQGHSSPQKRINVQEELRRLRKDPLMPMIIQLQDRQQWAFLEDPTSRYQEAYWFYFCSLERFFTEMSPVIRFHQDPMYYLRHEGWRYGEKYTESQAKLAKRFHSIKRYVRLDFFNCLLHARIMLDRVIGLSRYFLTGENLPSFTSFSQHKKFFTRLDQPYGEHEEYAEYIRNQTDWFDMPLKPVRDKYLVHAGPAHIREFQFSKNMTDYRLTLRIPVDNEETEKISIPQYTIINVSIPQLAREIEQFLLRFCEYACPRLLPFPPQPQSQTYDHLPF